MMIKNYEDIFNKSLLEGNLIDNKDKILLLWCNILYNILLCLTVEGRCLFCEYEKDYLCKIINPQLDGILNKFANKNKDISNIKEINIISLFNDILKFLILLKTNNDKLLIDYVSKVKYEIVRKEIEFLLIKIQNKYINYKYSSITEFSKDFFYLYFYLFYKLGFIQI